MRGSGALKACYPPGHGEEPLPDFQGRTFWHLIFTYGAQTRPKAGEVWRFLVDATPGSQKNADKRRAQVLIPPGQERRLFAARSELRIPGTAPMTYVHDPTPATSICWVEDGDAGYNGSAELPSPPVLVRDAWGRDTPLPMGVAA